MSPRVGGAGRRLLGGRTRAGLLGRAAQGQLVHRLLLPQSLPGTHHGCKHLVLVLQHGMHCVLVEQPVVLSRACLLYTSDAADEEDSVDLGGCRVIKKKKRKKNEI
eukprot:TRINITY_DN26690_c0_g1_i3.p3 TRINITY_DN26690_c0_g1~~TRINITY_DN26690_c0_g1_i3.p3  ORF type:complete len:106 (+),score=1.88 TRINITY_DN26690_c0_g1_i3:891-1208(+)